VASVVADVLLEPALTGWQAFVIRRHYRSALSLPMLEEGKPFGVLTIYESEPQAFDDDQVAMFSELVNDIAYGVTNLRARSAFAETQQALQDSECFAQAAFDALSAHVLVLDEFGTILMVNRSLCEFTGRDPTGQNYLAVCDSAGGPMDRDAIPFAAGIRSVINNETTQFRLEYPSRTDRGEHWFIGKVTRYACDDRVRIVVAHEEITERKAHESHIEYQATHDALTGLANRTLLMDRVQHAIRHARRANALVALLFLDLDRFKDVNDSFGHAVGDALLQAVAQRLTSLVRSDDSLARLGGDEFVILLSDVQSPRNVSAIASKIIHAFSTPFMVEGRHLYMTTSIGATVFPQDGDEIDALYRNADSAMYRAKLASGNSFQFYSQDMSEHVNERSKMERELRHAILHREFELHYQPVVDLSSGAVVGAEALLRWQHPELGIILPEVFMPVAEETGMMVQIGAWVIRRACLQNRSWQDAGLAPIWVSVNLSARQLNQYDLQDTVAWALRETGLPAQYLSLEITESLLMGNAADIRDKLQTLKAIGLQLTIDDFGTSYSSLSSLKGFPVDAIKIDLAFIRDLPHDQDNAAIVRAAIALAHSLGLRVVAEGVENDEQIAFLCEQGCDQMQGFVYSAALSAQEFSQLAVTFG
jgi:diguanylate cyclase (GGDEF)-like protein